MINISPTASNPPAINFAENTLFTLLHSKTDVQEKLNNALDGMLGPLLDSPENLLASPIQILGVEHALAFLGLNASQLPASLNVEQMRMDIGVLQKQFVILYLFRENYEPYISEYGGLQDEVFGLMPVLQRISSFYLGILQIFDVPNTTLSLEGVFFIYRQIANAMFTCMAIANAATVRFPISRSQDNRITLVKRAYTFNYKAAEFLHQINYYKNEIDQKLLSAAGRYRAFLAYQMEYGPNAPIPGVQILSDVGNLSFKANIFCRPPYYPSYFTFQAVEGGFDVFIDQPNLPLGIIGSNKLNKVFADSNNPVKTPFKFIPHPTEPEKMQIIFGIGYWVLFSNGAIINWIMGRLQPSAFSLVAPS